MYFIIYLCLIIESRKYKIVHRQKHICEYMLNSVKMKSIIFQISDGIKLFIDKQTHFHVTNEAKI